MHYKRLCIFGGSFNPIHNRHIDIALATINEFNIDKLLIIPTLNPPHKDKISVSLMHRLNMINLSFAYTNKIDVIDLESFRSGNIYAVDTIKKIRELYSFDKLFYLIGEDSLNHLKEWYNYNDIISSVEFIVSSRFTNNVFTNIDNIVLNFLSIKPINISSTNIRNQLLNGYTKDIPVPVLEYIFMCNLYGTNQNNDYSKEISILSNILSYKRLAHSLSVVNFIRKLLEFHKDIDKEKILLAGLLHDCAKCLSFSTQNFIASNSNLNIDISNKNTAIIHGPTGSKLINYIFDINDTDIESSIYNHTTGNENMNDFDMIVFLSDKLEESRRYYEGIDEMRKIALYDLKKAMIMSLNSSKRYLENTDNKFHPDSMKLLNKLMKEEKNNG